MVNNFIDENIIFYDDGKLPNKNYNWKFSDNLIINTDSDGTTLKMPKIGESFFCSPNVILSGDFEISMDILMPKGSNFLSFGFGKEQNIFQQYKGWWNTFDYQEICIRRIDGHVNYFINNEFKGSLEFESDNIFFQFRLYSPKDAFDFSFRNFKIVKLNYENPHHLAKKIDNLNIQIKLLNSKLDQNDKIIDTYHRYFNSIFVDHKLEQRPLLQNTQELCLELMIFIENICLKHNLEYWMDGGILLGAIRHGGFVPWDDDIDIGMMRSDRNNLMEILRDEIKNYNLENELEVIYDDVVKKNHIITNVQVSYKYENTTIAGLDILVYDYLKSYDKDWVRKYNLEQRNHYSKLLNGMTREQLFDEIFEKLNLTYDKTNHICLGVETAYYPRKKIMDADMIFPLKKISFEGRDFPCPNNERKYMDMYYPGDYMEIPKIAAFHNRGRALKQNENILQGYDKALKKIKEVNEKFK